MPRSSNVPATEYPRASAQRSPLFGLCQVGDFAGIGLVVVKVRYTGTDDGAQRPGHVVQSSAQYNVKATGHVAKLRRDISV
jgi:hypothetical protein